MYWLQPPPYLRWAAATALLVGAAAWDLRGSGTEQHPFAATEIAAGVELTDALVEWRRLPAGAFDIPELEGVVPRVDLAAGDPISGSVVGAPPAVPADWWAVPMAVGSHSRPGDGVLLVIVDAQLTVPGIVVEAQRGDRTSLDFSPALVAVPGERAPLVAAAEKAGLLVTAVRP